MRWEPNRSAPALPYTPPSSFWTAVWRGARNRCPVCGEGRVFVGYLRIVDACESCGAPLGRLRADDAPPYFTIFVVGHIVVPGMLLLEQNVHPPSWVHMVTWVPVTLLLTLALLPPIKGAVIGAQWALRMKS